MSIRDLAPWWRSDETGGKNELTQPLADFHREMDRVFANFFKGFDLAPVFGEKGGNGQLVPRVDVSETDKEVQVTADLPGLDEKEIEVTLSNGNLTIKGEKKAEKEEKGKEFHRVERSYGMYQRVVPLPCEVEENKVSADFSKGVLIVKLPKSKQAKAASKKIQVKSAKS